MSDVLWFQLRWNVILTLFAFSSRKLAETLFTMVRILLHFLLRKDLP